MLNIAGIRRRQGASGQAAPAWLESSIGLLDVRFLFEWPEMSKIPGAMLNPRCLNPRRNHVNRESQRASRRGLKQR